MVGLAESAPLYPFAKSKVPLAYFLIDFGRVVEKRRELCKQHIGVFIPPRPSRGYGLLEKYRTAKSSFRFPLDKPFPFALIGKTVKVLVRQRNADNAE